MSDVCHWLYLIDVDLEPETVGQIASSTYDMVVLAFFLSAANNTDCSMADVVARLHDSPHLTLGSRLWQH